MFNKSVVTLIYEGKGKASNGSPLTLTLTKSIKCNEMETFSNQYYNEQNRNMRKSRNLRVPTHYTLDIVEENIRYELLYVEYFNRRYKVRNILKARDTRREMILDIQEVES